MYFNFVSVLINVVFVKVLFI